ncbi:MAG TPA: hypothetical protein VGC74_16925 [Stenotrophomonas sp.]|jgi:hypothetical protein
MNNKITHTLIVVLLVIGVVLVFWVSPTLLGAYVMRAPSAPDHGVGAIYEFNQHGTVVFLTCRQLLLAHGSAALGVVLLVWCGWLAKSRFKK